MKRLLPWINLSVVLVFYIWLCLKGSVWLNGITTEYYENKYRVVQLERQLRECEGKP